MEVDDLPRPSRKRRRRKRPLKVDASSAAKKPWVSSDWTAWLLPPKMALLWEGSVRPPKPSTRQPTVEGSMGEGSTPPPKMEPTKEEAEQKVFAKEFGATRPRLLPEAYELLEEDPDAISTPVDPQPTNEELMDKAKASDENSLITNSPEFCSHRNEKLDLEAKRPASPSSEAWRPAWRFLSSNNQT